MRTRMIKRVIATGLVFTTCLSVCSGTLFGANVSNTVQAKVVDDDVVTLRVCNWEEYIDLGDWSEEERIELENGVEIFGEQSMIEDFEDWYLETYGQKVQVEYSCFGTNEDLYNQITLGDKYDLVCPSDYMLMKLIAEDMAVPFSEGFFDTADENNYYINGVSPYIKQVFEENTINGEAWSKYAAGYMWGITGFLYNPAAVAEKDIKSWDVLVNSKYKRQITVKDNVRDTYFAILGMLKKDKLLSEAFLSDPDYTKKLAEEMNDVSTETIAEALTLLQQTRENVYSFETDSGKSDMVTGKVVASYQWSGDAVFAMDLADADGVELSFAVPEECTNLFFDGWVMLKNGLSEDDRKQHAAEAFVNFVSRPDNAVRNMYYIGYTSVIGGGEDTTMMDYVRYNYENTEAENPVEYSVGYFFSGDSDDEDCVIIADASQVNRQLFAQYPTEEAIHRSAIMGYYPADKNAEINQMWIEMRCFNLNRVPMVVWIIIGALLVVAILGAVLHKRSRS